MIERREMERRVGRTRFWFPERRTGFDRRASDGRIGWYRDRPHIVAAVLAAVLLLNLADYLLTLRALDLGATEVNPIMAVLFEIGPAVAGSVKLLLTLGVVLVIWQMRRYRRILEISLIALAGFTLVLAYQLTLVVNT